MLSLVCLLSIILSGCGESSYVVFEETVFDSKISFSVEALGGNANIAIKEMSAFIKQLNAEIHPDNDTALKRFNDASAGEEIKIGESFYKLITESKRLYELSGGAFNPCLFTLSKLWEVDAQGIAEHNVFDGVPPQKLPDYADVMAALAKTDFDSVTAYQRDGEYYATKGVDGLMIELGAIAKGYAVDACRDIADKYGLDSAKIDISGNYYFYKQYYNKEYGAMNWLIGVTDPRPRIDIDREPVCAFSEEGDISVVTSGDYQRFYRFNYGTDGNKDYVYVQHIINPFTGLPVGLEYDAERRRYFNSDDYVISATVIGKSSMECDSLATAVCVMGLDKGVKLLKENGFDGFVFTEEKFALIGAELFRTDFYDGYKSYTPYLCYD